MDEEFIDNDLFVEYKDCKYLCVDERTKNEFLMFIEFMDEVDELERFLNAC